MGTADTSPESPGPWPDSTSGPNAIAWLIDLIDEQPLPPPELTASLLRIPQQAAIPGTTIPQARED